MVGLAAGAAGHGDGALDQSGGGRDQRRLRPERHPEPPDRRARRRAPRSTARGAGPSPREASARAPAPSRSGGRAGSAPRRARYRGRQRLDRRRAGAVQLRRRPARARRAGRPRRSAARASPRGARRRARRGSIMIVVATDAPLSDRNLGRLAARAIAGPGSHRVGVGNGSGDYVIAFSTAPAASAAASARRGSRTDRARERRDDRAVPGRHRGHRGGDLQLALHRDDRDARKAGRSRRFRWRRSGGSWTGTGCSSDSDGAPPFRYPW